MYTPKEHQGFQELYEEENIEQVIHSTLVNTTVLILRERK